MTTFRLDDSQGPGTHVFIIGVGHYPHLRGGGSDKQVRKQNGMGQLTCAPLSARVFLDWADRQLKNTEAPLKSIEVLLSEENPTPYTDKDNLTLPIEEATIARVRTAADAWYTRLESHPDNVAIFYFCGHGLGDGVHTQLLLRDYGEQRIAMDGSIDFNGFRLAMGSCPASKQIYFVDACRATDASMLVDPNQRGNALLEANVVKLGGANNPAFFAVRQGEEAFGVAGSVSNFTGALIQGLNRFGVFRARGKNWVVQPHQLHLAVAALMGAPWTKPACVVDGLVGTGFAVHEIDEQPQAVLDIYLSEPDASTSAKISCTFSGQTQVRETTDHPWRTRVPHGECELGATFPADSEYRTSTISETILPPFQEVCVEVR